MLRGQYDSFQAESVMTMKTVLPRSSYDTHAKREAYYEQVVERVRAVPGVVAAGYTNALPLDYRGDATGIFVEGLPPEPKGENEINTRLVNGDFLEALGVTLRSGRHFTDADGPQALPVAIVNESAAKHYWHGEDPIGRRFKVGDPDDDTPWVTVVGVVSDVRQSDVESPAKSEMYLPYRQGAYLEVFAPKVLAVRTSGDQGSVVATVRGQVSSVDPSVPLSDVRTMDEIVGKAMSGRRVGTTLVGAFAAVALLLTSVGIYGLLSHRVQQMMPEIGVRLALGASPRDVFGLIVWRGMRLILVGMAAGLALAFAATRLMQSILFGVSAGDPLTFAGAPIVLGTVALLACFLPARRAASIDPNAALRSE
jgi:putative ABC transport system permease protein